MRRSFLISLILATAACRSEAIRTESAGASVVIVSADEPGERLLFSGRVIDERSQPLPGAAVLAYHTDATGLYNRPGSGTRVPRLRGIAISDESGRFRFTTIRPAPYPEGGEPAHIHMGSLAPAHHVRRFEFWFRDDPLIRGRQPQSVVIVDLEREAGGAWTFQYDIRLEGN